jgi:uncharacterized membrane protein
VSYPLNAAPEAKMLNDFDTDTTPETAELSEDAQDLINLYRVQRNKLAEMVSALGSGHTEVLKYAKVVSLTARELLGEHGVDADEVVDAIELKARAIEILGRISERTSYEFAWALRSVVATTTVHRTGALADSFYEVIGRMPITISTERREALRKLTNLKAVTLDVRPANVHATTHTYQQVILTDLGRAMLADLNA